MGGDELARVALAQDFRVDVFGQEKLQPVKQLGRGGLFLQAGNRAQLKEHVERFGEEPALEVGEVHLDDLLHGLLVGKRDEVEEAPAQEGVGQFLLVVGGDDHDGPDLGADRLAGLVDIELHPVEFLQEIVGKLDIGFVDFVDQQDRALGCVERLPQLALADIVLHVVNAVIAQLAVAQARHGVILVKALAGLGGGLDMPFEKRRAGGGGDLAGELGLAGARLPLHQERPLQDHCGVHRGSELVGGDIGFGSVKAHGGPC